MKMQRSVFLVLTLSLGLLGACSQAPAEAYAPKAMMAEASGNSLGIGDRMAQPLAEAAPPPPEPQSMVRKQVKNGYLQLEVGDLKEAETAVSDQTAALGGYVESSSLSPQQTVLQLRVPAEKLETLLSGLGGLGKTLSRQVSVSDVTSQYYDLETRLKNQKLLLDQYRTLLTQAKNLEDTLEIMGRISALTSEIESVEGQFRYLSTQIALSSLSVTLDLPALQGGKMWPDLGSGFEEFGFATLEFFYGLIFVLLGLVVYGLPIAGVVVLVVWLFIGRPGLWRRLKGLKYTSEK